MNGERNRARALKLIKLHFVKKLNNFKKLKSLIYNGFRVLCHCEALAEAIQKLKFNDFFLDCPVARKLYLSKTILNRFFGRVRNDKRTFNALALYFSPFSIAFCPSLSCLLSSAIYFIKFTHAQIAFLVKNLSYCWAFPYPNIIPKMKSSSTESLFNSLYENCLMISMHVGMPKKTLILLFSRG